MKVASYRHGIEWIALNDDPMALNMDVVEQMISVCLLADLFGVLPGIVAAKVVNYRLELTGKGYKQFKCLK